ncbi:hypothetical protein SLEP1_g23435 [Rubroshorea leprosula]|uniref:Uncharacterized protein n=1 Tax=Rubroshorea leprosula TaxID=152421 RepID=A0AAV5JCD3_9ROSI|nr:hypothetical protein SLEP1_g23435 [Rubroshorea leprosula]
MEASNQRNQQFPSRRESESKLLQGKAWNGNAEEGESTSSTAAFIVQI